MSFFFNERIAEQQKKDPLKETITFTYPWIITIPPQLWSQPEEDDDEEEYELNEMFQTNYKYYSESWYLFLRRSGVSLFTSYHLNENNEQVQVWNGTCFISYNLYSDNDMKLLLYSSPRIQMINVEPNRDLFETPDGYTTKLVEATIKKEIARVVILIETHLPSKYFCRPFDMPTCNLDKEQCDEVPTDAENDYRFEFLKKSDFTFKCRNGLMPASRMMLNLSSLLMKLWFKDNSDSELFVVHAIDVVKPVVIYLHTRCFQMPQVYDLDYAKRLLKAVDFFDGEHDNRIIKAVHLSLCQKFIQESHNFDSILQWTSLSSRQSLHHLQKMVATVIADKYFFKWQETFPQDTRNASNPIFRHVFGSDGKNQSKDFFKKIDDFKKYSFMTSVILG